MCSSDLAARMASWAGVRAVIAKASLPNVLIDAVNDAGVGTTFLPSSRALPARKLWIGFASNVEGSVVVDDGAAKALIERGTSLLPAGITAVNGTFEDGAVIEVRNASGVAVARGIALIDSATLGDVKGRRTSDLPDRVAHEAVHRDEIGRAHV